MKVSPLASAWKTGASLSSSFLAQSTPEETAAILGNIENIAFAVLKSIAEVRVYADEHNVTISEARKVIEARNKDEQELIDAARGRLLSRIESNEVCAIGFEPPRRLTSEPVIIPIECLRLHHNWRKNDISVGSLTFVEVRIVSAPTTRTTVLSTNNAGRKSRRDFYFSCFDALQQAGKLDTSVSINHAFPNVREWLSQHFPDEFPNADVGSDKTIYRYLNEFKSASNLN